MKKLFTVLAVGMLVFVFAGSQADAQARCPVCGGQVYSGSHPYSSYYSGNLPSTGMENYRSSQPYRSYSGTPPYSSYYGTQPYSGYYGTQPYSGYYGTQPYSGYYSPDYYNYPGTGSYYGGYGSDTSGTGHMSGHPQSGTGMYTSPYSPY